MTFGRFRWLRFCFSHRRYDDDDGEDRTVGDWRSGPRTVAQSPPRGDRDRGYGDRDGGRRGFDRYEAPRDRGYDRGGDRGGDRGRWLWLHTPHSSLIFPKTLVDSTVPCKCRLVGFGRPISDHNDRNTFLEQMATVDTIEAIEVAMIHTEMVVVAGDTTKEEVRDASPPRFED